MLYHNCYANAFKFFKKMIRKAKMSVIDAKLGGRKQDTELLKPREAGLFKSL